MGQRRVVTLEDDIDGGEATQTLRFGFDGTLYEIDLNDKNAERFHRAIQPYVERGRKVSGRGTGRGGGSSNGSAVDNRAVRAWAASNGVEVSPRGRIPTTVIQQYRAAGN